jgi:hypothetical protein
MRNVKLILACHSILLLAFTCENKEDSSQEAPEKQIIGEWEWLESVYYYTMSGIPYIMNPDTVGYSMKHVYLLDGTLKIYKNGILEASCSYWFDNIVYPNGTESDLRLMTQKDDFVKSVKFSINNDTLVLDNTEVDDARRIFIRKR